MSLETATLVARVIEGWLGLGLVVGVLFAFLGTAKVDPDARGAIFGITRDTGVAQLVRATLESVCYQTFDLLQAKRRDGLMPTRLRVDVAPYAIEWAVLGRGEDPKLYRPFTAVESAVPWIFLALHVFVALASVGGALVGVGA